MGNIAYFPTTVTIEYPSSKGLLYEIPLVWLQRLRRCDNRAEGLDPRTPRSTMGGEYLEDTGVGYQ